MPTDIVTIPAEAKQSVLSAQQQANLLKVTNPDQAQDASDLLRVIKTYHKNLIERKEEMTRPLMKSLASIRDLFKPLESDLTDAEKTTKSKLLAYQIEEEERVAKETAKIEARVEKGTKKVGGIQTRTLTKVRVMDETMIPREYMIPNMPKITEAILHQNVDVPGVEKYEEKSLASV